MSSNSSDVDYSSNNFEIELPKDNIDAILENPQKWGEEVAWGGELRCETTQLSVITFDGIEATASLGTPTLNYDMIFDITGPAAMGAGLGTPNINNHRIVLGILKMEVEYNY